MANIDTEALLESLDIVALVSERVTLRRAGKEFTGLCPFHDDKSAGSFTVSPQKRFYHCFSCGEHGDAINWRMFTDGVDFIEACRRLGSGLSIAVGVTKKDARPAVPARITKAPPPGTPLPRTSSIRWGEPSMTWTYKDAEGNPLGVVARYDYFEDGKAKKLTPQWTWGSRDGGQTWGWGMGHWNTPRPLYGLDVLAQRPKAPVVIVEGEKCAEAVRQLLPNYVPITWPGGSNAVDYADWSPLAGRNVLIWPDADAPGWTAGELIAERLKDQATKLRVLDTTGRPEHWDAADALEEGWSSQQTYEWAKGVIRDLVPPPAPTEPAPPPASEEPPLPEQAPDDTPPPAPKKKATKRGPLTLTTGGAEPAPDQSPDSFITWESLGLKMNGKGLPHLNLDNCVRVLEHHAFTAGKIWFDEFHQKVFSTLSGTTREVTDADTLLVTRWMQQEVGLHGVSDDLVFKSMRLAARTHIRHEPREWMERLVWDGNPRLWQMTSVYFGTTHDKYHSAVGRNFMRSMVARIYRPGCKVDTMMILEGEQGTFKSTALSILGGAWYCVMQESIHSKDFYGALQGKLLVELAEMDVLRGTEITKVKSVLDTRIDRYRSPYGRLTEDHPRQNVFVGSTNEDTYLEDVTGNRRFWPIRCGRIDFEALQRDRDQLFAEAVAEFKAGETWWEMPRETREHQEDRRTQDEWEACVVRYLNQKQVQDGPESPWVWMPREHPMESVAMSDILQYGLEIPIGRWTRADQIRVAKCLKAMGWTRRRATGEGWLYFRPGT